MNPLSSLPPGVTDAMIEDQCSFQCPRCGQTLADWSEADDCRDPLCPREESDAGQNPDED